MSVIEYCPLCLTLFNGIQKTTHEDSGIVYTLWECTKCSAQFWDPLKNPGAGWYERDERYANRNLDPILKPNKKHIDTIEYLKGKCGMNHLCQE